MKPLILITLSPDIDDSGRRVHDVPDSIIRAVEDAGGVPVLLPVGIELEAAQAVLTQVQGLLLPGGWDFEGHRYRPVAAAHLNNPEPELDALDFAIFQWARDQKVPTLGICRGMQLISLEHEGDMHLHLPEDLPEAEEHKPANVPHHQTVHEVAVKPGTLLASIVGEQPFRVNSRHHQAVRHPGEGVVVSGTAPDGVIEAIEVPSQPFMLGVQFHPEDLYRTEPTSRKLFEAFIAAARAYNNRHA
ncbi:MAG TPA: gamma-glutamyl-gamma-aminobutyrate hydrolase family protein [Candidatus Acidoferrum sp.]|nr:gamma-glutamyl-gamma-aminobutyrate hydrolase family protein [Candidatus Acidoferrum sp.]